jgi:hypothetical protein
MSPTERKEEMAHWRGLLKSLGNLSESEIEELLTLEFVDQLTVSQQLRRYYLKLKSEKPAKAEQMWAAIPRSYKRRVTSRKAVKRLCATLYCYWSGFVLHFNGRTYSVSGQKFYRIN